MRRQPQPVEVYHGADSEFRVWVYAGVALQQGEIPSLADIFLETVKPEHHGVLAGVTDAAKRASLFEKVLAKAVNVCWGCEHSRTARCTCVGIFGAPVPRKITLNPKAVDPLAASNQVSQKWGFFTARGALPATARRLVKNAESDPEPRVWTGLEARCLSAGHDLADAKNIYTTLNFSSYIRDEAALASNVLKGWGEKLDKIVPADRPKPAPAAAVVAARAVAAAVRVPAGAAAATPATAILAASNTTVAGDASQPGLSGSAATPGPANLPTGSGDAVTATMQASGVIDAFAKDPARIDVARTLAEGYESRGNDEKAAVWTAMVQQAEQQQSSAAMAASSGTTRRVTRCVTRLRLPSTRGASGLQPEESVRVGAGLAARAANKDVLTTGVMAAAMTVGGAASPTGATTVRLSPAEEVAMDVTDAQAYALVKRQEEEALLQKQSELQEKQEKLLQEQSELHEKQKQLTQTHRKTKKSAERRQGILVSKFKRARFPVAIREEPSS